MIFIVVSSSFWCLLFFFFCVTPAVCARPGEHYPPLLLQAFCIYTIYVCIFRARSFVRFFYVEMTFPIPNYPKTQDIYIYLHEPCSNVYLKLFLLKLHWQRSLDHDYFIWMWNNKVYCISLIARSTGSLQKNMTGAITIFVSQKKKITDTTSLIYCIHIEFGF